MYYNTHIMKADTHKIGRMGENIVKNLLDRSEFSKPRDFYDIDWEGIKIEVKTSTYKVPSGKFQVNARSSITGKKPDVFVIVGVDSVGEHFWVKRNFNYGTALMKKEDEIQKKEFANEVVRISKEVK